MEIITALVLTGARGSTYSELAKGLHLPATKDAVEDMVKQVLPTLKGNEANKLSLSTANKVFVKEGFNINNNFK